MNDRSVDVLVVGGGPAGMVAGCLLARAGLQTLVLERGENFDRELRGEVLQPRFHQATRDMGLYDHLARYPHEEIDQAHVYFSGQRIGGLNLRRLAPRSGTTWWMTQPDLLGALHDYGRASERFELWFDAALRRLEGGTAWVEHGGTDVRIAAKVVIGADGRYSTVRRLGGFEMAYDRHDLDVIWFVLPRPKDYEHHFSFFLSPEHNYLILPKHPNRLQCGIVLQPGEFSTIRHGPIEALRDEIARAHPVFAEFAAGLQDYSPFRPLKGNTALVREWARDGVVLIGDAAHTCSPAGGIGVAVAVETACVAVSVILEAFARNDFSRAQLGRIQAQRMPDIRQVHGIQGLGAIMVKSPRWMRRFASLAFKLGDRFGLLPIFARRLLTQRRPLPDVRGRMA